MYKILLAAILCIGLAHGYVHHIEKGIHTLDGELSKAGSKCIFTMNHKSQSSFFMFVDNIKECPKSASVRLKLEFKQECHQGCKAKKIGKIDKIITPSIIKSYDGIIK